MICNRTGIQYGTGIEYGYCMSSPDRGIGIVYGGTKYCWFWNVLVCVILVSRVTNKERLLLFIYIYIYTVIYIYIYIIRITSWLNISEVYPRSHLVTDPRKERTRSCVSKLDNKGVKRVCYPPKKTFYAENICKGGRTEVG